MSPVGDAYPLRVQVELITPPLNLLFDLGEVGGGQRRVRSLHTEAEGRAWCLSPKPQAERYGIRTYIPPVGTGGDLHHHRAESAIFAHRGRRPSVARVANEVSGEGGCPLSGA